MKTNFVKSLLSLTAIALSSIPSLQAQDQIPISLTYKLKWSDNHTETGKRYDRFTDGDIYGVYSTGVYGKTIAKDPQGNILCLNAGIENSSRFFTITKYPSSANLTSTPALIIPIFRTQYLMPGNAIHVSKIITDAYSNIYVSGGHSGGSGFLMKMDPNGNVLWTESGLGMGIIDMVIYNGTAQSDVAIYITGSDASLSIGANHVFVKKYTTNKVLSWTKSYGYGDVNAIQIDESSPVAKAASGNHAIYLTGYYGGTHAHTYPFVTSIATSNGNNLWWDDFSTGNFPGIREAGLKVITDNLGGIYVLGAVQGASLDVALLKYPFTPVIDGTDEATPSWRILQESDNFINSSRACDIELDPSQKGVYLAYSRYDASTNRQAPVVKKYLTTTGAARWTYNPPSNSIVDEFPIDLAVSNDNTVACLYRSTPDNQGKNEQLGMVAFQGELGTVHSKVTYLAPNGYTRTVGLSLSMDIQQHAYINGYSSDEADCCTYPTPSISAATNLAYWLQPKTTSNPGGTLPHVIGLRQAAPTEESMVQTMLFPNPAKGETMLSFSTEAQRKIQVLSIDGKLMQEISSTATNVPVNISGIAPGTYLVRTVSDSDVNVQRLVVE